MSRSYISYRRRNYQVNSRTCLYSDVFDATRYFVKPPPGASWDGWKVCTSCYCAVHGERQRQLRDDAIQDLFRGYQHYSCVSIHYGQVRDDATRRAILTAFRRRLLQAYPTAKVVAISHWKPARNNRRQLLRHHHVVIATHTPLSRREVRSWLPSRGLGGRHLACDPVRLGFETDTSPGSYLDYCLFLGRNKCNMVLPPPTATWEMVRVPKRVRRHRDALGIDGTIVSAHEEKSAPEQLKPTAKTLHKEEQPTRRGILITITSYAKLRILEDLLESVTSGNFTGTLNTCQVGLYTNQISADDSLELSDLTEPTFDGYERQDVVWDSPFASGTTSCKVTADTCEFLCSGGEPDDTIVGWFLLDHATSGNPLLALEAFDNPVPIGTPGDGLVVVPVIQLGDVDFGSGVVIS